MTVPVVAIDGPSGSGKGTVAAAVAEALGFHLLDSGALYRLVAYAALARDVALDDAEALASLARDLRIEFDFTATEAASVRLDGEAVGEAIRSEEVASAASRVAALTPVREALLDVQRNFREPPGLVADGRDMGTVVFPDAECKLFLTASAEERANRRYKQLKEKGIDVKFPALLGEIRARDERDRNRSVAPLKPAPDAHTLDTSEMSIEDVVDSVLSFVRERLV
ncbi:MAG: (d)CMP kinase [Xanthomonadales bacterium]|nr:(d)CMP kinase [Xanthomonadales bacterium]